MSGTVFFALHLAEMVDILSYWHWHCGLYLHILLSVGAPRAIMGTLECQAAPARGVIAACMALFTGTVTSGLGSASAGEGPRGCDARNVNPGTFWWKAIVFVGIFLPNCLKVVFPLNCFSIVFLLLRPMASAGESPILTKQGLLCILPNWTFHSAFGAEAEGPRVAAFISLAL